jgi:enoyl-CoA hydratase/carnithine racemase
MSEHVIVTRQGAVLVLRLERPEKKNALTVAMYAALADALGAAAADAGVRAVLVTGSGDAFTSGNDLHDFVANPPSGPDSPVFRFLTALASFPKPIVAAVNGLAIGIGTTMLLHCDLVVADEAARFQLPFINLGLVPEAASSLLLPQLVGHRVAAELLLLGTPFDAHRAATLGIVNKVAEQGAALREATAWAVALTEKAPSALAHGKRLLLAPDRGVAARMQEEAAAFVAQLAGPEFLEAVTAFREKRTPRFT